MNYETNSFGMDVLFSIRAQGEPYLRDAMPQETQTNELFTRNDAQRKEEAAYFLSEYYSSGFEILPEEQEQEEEKENKCLSLKEEGEEYSVVGIKIKAEDPYHMQGIKFEEEGDSEKVKSEEF